MKKTRKNIIKALAVTMMLSNITPIFADTNPKVTYIKGEDRVLTSIYASRLYKSDTLVVASANEFADALSAYNLVKKFNSRLILVNNDSNIISELSNIKTVYIVGGEKSLSGKVINDIKSNVSNVKRVSGVDRYATNKETLKISDYKEVGVADGRNFPDALSASGLLSNKGLGLMLTDGSKSYTTSLTVKYTFGGNSSVIQSGGKRLAGYDRYKTSEAINREFNSSTKVVADGSQFADALSAINVLNLGNANVILVNTSLDKNLLKDAKDVYIIGGLVKLNDNLSNNKSGETKSVIPNIKPSIPEKPKNNEPNKPNLKLKDPINPKPSDPIKPEPKPADPINPKPDLKPIEPKDEWVKKEKIEIETIPEKYESVIEEVDIIRNHEFTLDGEIDITQKFIDKGFLIKDLLDQTIGAVPNPEFLKVCEEIRVKCSVKQMIKGDKEALVNKLINNNVNSEVAGGYIKLLLGLAKTEIVNEINNVNDNISLNIENYNSSYPNSTAIYKLIIEGEKNFIQYEQDNKSLSENNEPNIKPVVVGKEKKSVQKKVADAYEKKYKITWEENTKTGQKRNEQKIEIK